MQSEIVQLRSRIESSEFKDNIEPISNKIAELLHELEKKQKQEIVSVVHLLRYFISNLFKLKKIPKENEAIVDNIIRAIFETSLTFLINCDDHFQALLFDLLNEKTIFYQNSPKNQEKYYPYFLNHLTTFLSQCVKREVCQFQNQIFFIIKLINNKCKIWKNYCDFNKTNDLISDILIIFNYFLTFQKESLQSLKPFAKVFNNSLDIGLETNDITLIDFILEISLSFKTSHNQSLIQIGQSIFTRIKNENGKILDDWKCFYRSIIKDDCESTQKIQTGFIDKFDQEDQTLLSNTSNNELINDEESSMSQSDSIQISKLFQDLISSPDPIEFLNREIAYIEICPKTIDNIIITANKYEKDKARMFIEEFLNQKLSFLSPDQCTHILFFYIKKWKNWEFILNLYIRKHDNINLIWSFADKFANQQICSEVLYLIKNLIFDQELFDERLIDNEYLQDFNCKGIDLLIGLFSKYSCDNELIIYKSFRKQFRVIILYQYHANGRNIANFLKKIYKECSREKNLLSLESAQMIFYLLEKCCDPLIDLSSFNFKVHYSSSLLNKDICQITIQYLDREIQLFPNFETKLRQIYISCSILFQIPLKKIKLELNSHAVKKKKRVKDYFTKNSKTFTLKLNTDNIEKCVMSPTFLVFPHLTDIADDLLEKLQKTRTESSQSIILELLCKLKTSPNISKLSEQEIIDQISNSKNIFYICYLFQVIIARNKVSNIIFFIDYFTGKKLRIRQVNLLLEIIYHYYESIPDFKINCLFQKLKSLLENKKLPDDTAEIVRNLEKKLCDFNKLMINHELNDDIELEDPYSMSDNIKSKPTESISSDSSHEEQIANQIIINMDEDINIDSISDQNELIQYILTLIKTPIKFVNAVNQARSSSKIQDNTISELLITNINETNIYLINDFPALYIDIITSLDSRARKQMEVFTLKLLNIQNSIPAISLKNNSEDLIKDLLNQEMNIVSSPGNIANLPELQKFVSNIIDILPSKSYNYVPDSNAYKRFTSLLRIFQLSATLIDVPNNEQSLEKIFNFVYNHTIKSLPDSNIYELFRLFKVFNKNTFRKFVTTNVDKISDLVFPFLLKSEYENEKIKNRAQKYLSIIFLTFFHIIGPFIQNSYLADKSLLDSFIIFIDKSDLAFIACLKNKSVINPKIVSILLENIIDNDNLSIEIFKTIINNHFLQEIIIKSKCALKSILIYFLKNFNSLLCIEPVINQLIENSESILDPFECSTNVIDIIKDTHNNDFTFRKELVKLSIKLCYFCSASKFQKNILETINRMNFDDDKQFWSLTYLYLGIFQTLDSKNIQNHLSYFDRIINYINLNDGITDELAFSFKLLSKICYKFHFTCNNDNEWICLLKKKLLQNKNLYDDANIDVLHFVRDILMITPRQAIIDEYYEITSHIEGISCDCADLNLFNAYLYFLSRNDLKNHFLRIHYLDTETIPDIFKYFR